jgi:hypothetical protein
MSEMDKILAKIRRERHGKPKVYCLYRDECDCLFSGEGKRQCIDFVRFIPGEYEDKVTSGKYDNIIFL